MRRFIIQLLLTITCLTAVAQEWVTGKVTDARTGETLPLVHVYYEDARRSGVAADEHGRYKIRYRVGRTLVFDAMGYEQATIITNRPGTRNVKMSETSYGLTEVVVERKRKRYTRKNNPAVELMRKVIANKRHSDIDALPYYSYRMYEKQTVSVNEFLADEQPNLVDSMARVKAGQVDTAAQAVDSLTGKKRKRGQFDFLMSYAERCEATGKTILPLMVEEKVKERIHRLSPQADKTYLLAQKSTGINDLFSIGAELNTVLADVFQDINIYNDDIRLFQRHFMSPIADAAIGFYRYYIEDTIRTPPLPSPAGEGAILSLSSGDKNTALSNKSNNSTPAPAVEGGGGIRYRLSFTPNNPQDFGFSGELIIEDGTWQVHSCEVNIPSRSGVNFVDDLRITQQFETLDDGSRVLTVNDMIVQMSLLDFLAKGQVQRTTRRMDFDFSPIDDDRFRGLAREIVDPDAELRDSTYWAQVRPMTLTNSEQRMDSLVHEITHVRGFKPLQFVLKAYGEDFIETGKTNSMIDIGPIRKLFAYNSVEGFRLLGGLQTTSALHPHLFFQGYAAYGFKDRRWKGKADLTWSFNKKRYRPHEFPVHALSLSYSNELMTAADRKLGENRSDMFSVLSFQKAEHQMYQEAWSLKYDVELANGLRMTMTGMREKVTPTGLLFFQPLGRVAGVTGDGTAGNGGGNGGGTGVTGVTAGTLPSVPLMNEACNLSHFNNTELSFKVRYQPGNTYVNSKKSRHETNKDAPIYEFSHTVSPKGLWGNQYMSNCTEMELYRRVWLSSWGRMDFTLRGQYQWNKVPFPLLNSPDANLTYVMMRRRFCLMRDMEFLNDRNLSMHWKWDLAGKLFNRIPLLRRLKWRETIGFNVLWGDLTDKNNPASSNYSDPELWHMPGRWVSVDDGSAPAMRWQQYSYALDPKKPYVELFAGIFNIFKFFNVTYVHRMNYNDHPDTSRWGIRVSMEFAF